MSNYHNQAAEKLEKIQSTPSAKRQISAKRGVDRDKKEAFGTFGTGVGGSIEKNKGSKGLERAGSLPEVRNVRPYIQGKLEE